MESLYYNGFQKMAEFLLNHDLVRQTLDLNSTIILAPSNEVLENSKSKQEIQEILQRHIFPNLEKIKFLNSENVLKRFNLNKEEIEFSVSKSQITCSIILEDDKKIEATLGENITVPKGIIFEINKLLM